MIANGQATVFCSGSEELVGFAQPALHSFATGAPYVGGVGAGSILKLITNALVGIHTLAAAEAIAIAEKAGLDAETAVDAISASVAGSKMIELRGPVMAQTS